FFLPISLVFIVKSPLAAQSYAAGDPALGRPGQCKPVLGISICPQNARMEVNEPLKRNQMFSLGQYKFLWIYNHKVKGQLLIFNDRHDNGSVWETAAGMGFLAAGRGDEKIIENRGSFTVTDRIREYCYHQRIDNFSGTENLLKISGGFEDDCPLRWSMDFHVTDEGHLAFNARTDGDDSYNRLFLTYSTDKGERFFGFGMQFTYFDLKGYEVPIITQEQGVGRSLQPLSVMADLTQGRGISGSPVTSYGSVPHYITSKYRSLFLTGSAISFFDLKDSDKVRIKIFKGQMEGRILAGSSPSELIESYTLYAGRMSELPLWVDNGAIIGLQGGTERVKSIQKQLDLHQVPVSAIWMQDWVGKRKTSFGSQLWWNWVLDESHYPEWRELVSSLDAKGIRVLTYLNPFLADITEKKSSDRNLFRQAADSGYLVKDSAGSAYMIKNTSFSAGLLDLSNPEATKWIKHIMKENLISTGAKGWMADFGEALPFDSRLMNADPKEYHNLYPEKWAALNREFLEEEGLWDETLFFSRSAYIKSPGKTRLFWLGDQLVSWDGYDGIKTAVVGLLSSGLSGFSLNHSDTGGYTTIKTPLMSYTRSKELFLRWTELGAFTSVLRTHEGNIPEANHQLYTDSGTLVHFSKFANIYKALSGYRRSLMAEASAKGLPVVRHLWIHYPDDREVLNLRYQFLLGRYLLLAPVLDKSREYVNVYLPDDHFIHLESGRAYRKGWHKVDAKIAHPALFYHDSMPQGEIPLDEIRELLLIK
ncbi:MAG: alpha-glucosidase, partial [Oligoflexales bacterium]|nr:alpha-glucosidase [Oligoflexales bacterium]